LSPRSFFLFTFSISLCTRTVTKLVCTARDVPGTKTSGRNGKMWKGENPTVFSVVFSAMVYVLISFLFFSEFFFFLFSRESPFDRPLKLEDSSVKTIEQQLNFLALSKATTTGIAESKQQLNVGNNFLTVHLRGYGRLPCSSDESNTLVPLMHT